MVLISGYNFRVTGRKTGARGVTTKTITFGMIALMKRRTKITSFYVELSLKVFKGA